MYDNSDSFLVMQESYQYTAQGKKQIACQSNLRKTQVFLTEVNDCRQCIGFLISSCLFIYLLTICEYK